MAISEYFMLWKIGDSFCMNQIEQIDAKLLVKKAVFSRDCVEINH